MVALSVKLKAASRGFFDSPKVLARLDKGVARALGWYGAVTRKAIRRAYGPPSQAKPRPAPRPPRARKENGLRQVAYFYDKRSQSVIVGVVRDSKRKVSGMTVARLHEEGGAAVMRVKRLGGGRNKRGRYTRTIFVRDPKAKPQRLTFASRPTVANAGAKNRRKALDKLKGAMGR